MSDFVIPNENLSPPSPAGYGAASAAIDEATKAVLDPIAKAGQYLHKVAQDAAFVNMQADLLHAKEGANAKAIDLVQQGPGKGFDFITSEGIDDNGQPAPMRTIKLNPDFQTYLDGAQQALADKYKAFPDVVKYALESFTGTAVEAHKAAYAEATKDAVANGKAGVDRALQYATNDAIKTGSTDLLDAFASNPTYQNFYHPEVLAEKVGAAKAAAQLGMLSKSLLDSVQNQGKDAAIAQLAQQTGIDEKDRNQLKGQIEAVDAGEQAQWTQKVIDGAVKAHDEGGMIYSQALDQLVSQVPGFRKEGVMKTADAYLAMKDKANNDKMKYSVNSYNSGNADEPGGHSWADTLRWFSDKDQKFQGNTGYQEEYSFIQRMAADERSNMDKTGAKIDWSKPQMMKGMQVATAENLSDLDKTNQFRKWAKDGTINGDEWHALEGSKKNSDKYLEHYVTGLHDMSRPDPQGNPGMLSAAEAAEASHVMTKAVRDRSAAGKPPDEAEMLKIFEQTKALYTEPKLRAAVDAAFANTAGGLASISKLWNPNDTEDIGKFTKLVQSGGISEIASQEQIQAMIGAMRPAQEKDLSGRVKGLTFSGKTTFSPQGLPIYPDTAGAHWSQVFNDATGRMEWRQLSKSAKVSDYPDPMKWGSPVWANK